MFGGFKKEKLKPSLKMAVSRFQMAANKKSALSKQQMREISKLLNQKPPKEEKARIRAEALIIDDGTIEVYEILQLSCELLSERIKLIASEKKCPDDLKGTIATLIWASNRVDIPELIDIRKQFKAKYGKKFEQDALSNKDSVCNERVLAKLSFQPPSAFLVQTYLEKIADQFKVDWKAAQRLSAEQLAQPMVAPVGSSVPFAPGTGLATAQAYPVNDLPTEVSLTDTSVRSNLDAQSISLSQAAPEASAPPPTAPSTAPDIVPPPIVPPPIIPAPCTPVTKKDEDIPVAEVMPVDPPKPYKEDDIYVPPPAPGYETDSKLYKTNGLEQNGEAGENGIDAGSTDDSYDQLKSRFENLKKM